MAAQECLPNNDVRDAFAAEYSVLGKLWEAISPDPMLLPFETDYRWLTQVYVSVQPTSGTGKLVWHALGAKTIELIHQNVHVDSVRDDLETLVLDAELLEAVMGSPDPKKRAKEFEIKLTARLRKHMGNPKYRALSERLEALKERHEQGLLNSVEFLKHLLETRARPREHREGHAARGRRRPRQGSPHRAIPAGERRQDARDGRARRRRHRRDRAPRALPWLADHGRWRTRSEEGACARACSSTSSTRTPTCSSARMATSASTTDDEPWRSQELTPPCSSELTQGRRRTAGSNFSRQAVVRRGLLP